MTLYALDDVQDAIAATRAFLWPLDLGRWGRLALVMFFVGGVGGGTPFQFTGGTSGGPSPEPPSTPGIPDVVPSIGEPEFAVIVVIFAILGLLALAFVLVGSIMEFVFVESLRREDVTIRRYWSERWKQGVQLFGFRLVLGLLSLGVVGLLVAAVFTPVLFGDGGLSLGLLFLAISVFVILAIVSGLLNGFTTQFVVPIMIVEERGLLSAWRRFWPTLTGQWKQYVAYVIVRFVLQIAVGILTSIVTLLAALVIAIPLGIVGLVGFGLLSVVEVAGWAVIAVAIVLFVFAAVVISLFVAVPVQTYLRYYALLVLGDTNDAFDVIAERRRAIRA